MFHLNDLPKRIVIAGGGYIANEFAGIFHQFGSHVTIVNRTDVILRGYDEQLRDRLLQISLAKGIDFKFNATFNGIAKQDDGSLMIDMEGCDDIEADEYCSRSGGVELEGLVLGGRVTLARMARSRTRRQPHQCAVNLRHRRCHRPHPADPRGHPQGQAFADTVSNQRRGRYSTTAPCSDAVPRSPASPGRGSARTNFIVRISHVLRSRPMKNVLPPQRTLAL